MIQTIRQFPSPATSRSENFKNEDGLRCYQEDFFNDTFTTTENKGKRLIFHRKKALNFSPPKQEDKIVLEDSTTVGSLQSTREDPLKLDAELYSTRSDISINSSRSILRKLSSFGSSLGKRNARLYRPELSLSTLKSCFLIKSETFPAFVLQNSDMEYS